MANDRPPVGVQTSVYLLVLVRKTRFAEVEAFILLESAGSVEYASFGVPGKAGTLLCVMPHLSCR